MNHVGIYRPSVRVGNWREEITLEKEALMEFLQQKDRGELTVQKNSVLKQNLLKPVALSPSPDGFLRFGDTVILINTRRTENPECVLSIVADLSDITTHLETNSKPYLRGPCQVGGASSIQPCVRNAFIITSVDETADGEILRYEQNFALRTTPGFGGELYLATDHKSFQKCAKKSRLQEVTLVKQLDFLCWWRLLYFNPQERLEHEGYPVQVNTKLLVSHCKTNQCLSALSDHTLWTVFGKESEITAHTFLDSHKAERDCNHWMLMTAAPGDEETRR